VQMLVEEHERGRVLVRISRRLRVTPFFVSTMAALFTVVLTLAFTGGGRWMMWALVAAIALALRAAWHAAATIALADTVMTRVLVESGAMPFSAPALGAAERAAAPVPTTLPVAVAGLDQPSTRHAA